ncbi:MAG: LysE family transporter [Candidatus Bathyarchaeota archaeon]|nr:LysE family transporter [Candidatus Bathyarchaeota archaeon]
MMPGPVFAVIIAKGYKNKIAGALIALGHGAVEFPLMFLIYFGFTWFFASTIVQKIMGLVGGLILIFMGFQIFQARKEKSENYGTFSHSSFVAGFLATIANPYFFLWWATIGANLILTTLAFGFAGFLALAIAHWSCDLAWDTFVSLVVFKSRRFWTEKTRRIVFGFCFVVLTGFGLWFILTAMF